MKTVMCVCICILIVLLVQMHTYKHFCGHCDSCLQRLAIQFGDRWSGISGHDYMCEITNSSVITEGPHDALSQLKTCELLHTCTKKLH